MNSGKKPVKSSVKEFYIAKTLSESQLNCLNEKLRSSMLKKQCYSNKNFLLKSFKWAGGFVVSFVLLFSIFSYLHTPDIISSAYADIYKDSTLNNGMQVAILQWLQENNIARVPQKFPVKMSKFCRLDSVLTTHLRIVGYNQGVMNVFFHQGVRPIHWINKTGIVDDMNWTLVKVRENLTVIVLYSFDMREKSVLHILDEMLPEFEV